MRLSELIANLQRMQEPGSGYDPEVIIECGLEADIKDIYAGKDCIYIEGEEN